MPDKVYNLLVQIRIPDLLDNRGHAAGAAVQIIKKGDRAEVKRETGERPVRTRHCEGFVHLCLPSGAGSLEHRGFREGLQMKVQFYPFRVCTQTEVRKPACCEGTVRHGKLTVSEQICIPAGSIAGAPVFRFGGGFYYFLP